MYPTLAVHAHGFTPQLWTFGDTTFTCSVRLMFCRFVKGVTLLAMDFLTQHHFFYEWILVVYTVFVSFTQRVLEHKNACDFLKRSTIAWVLTANVATATHARTQLPFTRTNANFVTSFARANATQRAFTTRPQRKARVNATPRTRERNAFASAKRPRAQLTQRTKHTQLIHTNAHATHERTARTLVRDAHANATHTRERNHPMWRKCWFALILNVCVCVCLCVCVYVYVCVCVCVCVCVETFGEPVQHSRHVKRCRCHLSSK